MMTEEPDRLDPDEVVPKLLHAKTRCLWARGQFALRFHSKEPPQKCLHPIFSVSRRVATAERCRRSEEHTSELQSLMRNSYAVFCLNKNNTPRRMTIDNEI